MLLKWLLLAILAWYVYRAGRNLVRAALGRVEEPLTGGGFRGSGGGIGGRGGGGAGGAGSRGGGGGAGAGSRGTWNGASQDDRIEVHAKPTPPSSRPPDSQVEDARFKDV